MMSSFKSLLVLLVLYLSSCSTLQSAEPGTLKKAHNMAMHALMVCGDDKVEKVDDGVSDAYTIAILLASECQSEYLQRIEMFSSTLDDRRKVDEYKAQINSKAFTVLVFLPLVLQHRDLLRKDMELQEGRL